MEAWDFELADAEGQPVRGRVVAMLALIAVRTADKPLTGEEIALRVAWTLGYKDEHAWEQARDENRAGLWSPVGKTLEALRDELGAVSTTSVNPSRWPWSKPPPDGVWWTLSQVGRRLSLTDVIAGPSAAPPEAPHFDRRSGFALMTALMIRMYGEQPEEQIQDRVCQAFGEPEALTRLSWDRSETIVSSRTRDTLSSLKRRYVASSQTRRLQGRPPYLRLKPTTWELDDTVASLGLSSLWRQVYEKVPHASWADESESEPVATPDQQPRVASESEQEGRSASPDAER